MELEMKNKAGLEFTAGSSEEIEIIDKLSDMFYRKQNGIDQILPEKADAYPNSPMLQVYAAQFFLFSFSLPVIKKHFPVYLSRLDALVASGIKLNERELLHFNALKILHEADLASALDVYTVIVNQYPEDRFAILMLEVCGFWGGEIESLLPVYTSLLDRYCSDPDFLSFYALVLSHIDRLDEARSYTEKALSLDPHNAGVQHVYAHTFNESDLADIEDGITFLESCAEDWPKQNRVFEGHNWMHLLGLYFVKGSVDFDMVLDKFSTHVWGEAKAFDFEQNNAFWVLWQAELNGFGKRIPTEIKKDLAFYAEASMYNYFTPYIAICAILSVAQYDTERALPGIEAFEAYAKSKGAGWYEVALPVLHGCIEYLKGHYKSAQALLSPVAEDVVATRPICQSDEQRIIFTATLNRIRTLLSAGVK